MATPLKSSMGRAACVAIVLSVASITSAADDPVLEWNGHAFNAFRVGTGTPAAPVPVTPLVTTRVAAMVQAAVFDAVNGIERRYTEIHVAPAAPMGASERAAAVQAAYRVLVTLFPGQQADLDAKLVASLTALTSGPAVEHSQSIIEGRAWGQSVADQILAWRSADGFTPAPPPYTGFPGVLGKWSPTPPNFLSGAAPQFATMTPWAIESPDQFLFLLPGPPSLGGSTYADDYNEVKESGRLRPFDDQTEIAFFWNGNTAGYWNRIAAQVSRRRHLTMSDNAHLFASLNLAMADAAIVCWNAKYLYVFWRPITAITTNLDDGNPQTDPEPGWLPLLTVTPTGALSAIATPNHPEYPSGHSTVSGAAAAILAGYFGDATSFTVDTETIPGDVHAFNSFSDAVLQIHDARVFGGIHFRSACRDGSVAGEAVAEYIFDHAMQRLHGK
jgi:hypothetical protein